MKKIKKFLWLLMISDDGWFIMFYTVISTYLEILMSQIRLVQSRCNVVQVEVGGALWRETFSCGSVCIHMTLHMNMKRICCNPSDSVSLTVGCVSFPANTIDHGQKSTCNEN